jgi:hypothetical protein
MNVDDVDRPCKRDRAVKLGRDIGGGDILVANDDTDDVCRIRREKMMKFARPFFEGAVLLSE